MTPANPSAGNHPLGQGAMGKSVWNGVDPDSDSDDDGKKAWLRYRVAAAAPMSGSPVCVTELGTGDTVDILSVLDRSCL